MWKFHTMQASLPMYDFAEIRTATDGFWALIAQCLKSDIKLTRNENWSALWHSPDLLFSQTCGYPFTHEFVGKLTYIGTPHYDADGCEGPLYRSIIFARKPQPIEEFKTSVCASNSHDSMSGMLALKLIFNQPDLGRCLITGSHAASLAAVQSSLADICAIDCVTAALLRRHRPQTFEGLVEITRSPLVPALPFVTRAGPVNELRQALSMAVRSNAAKILLLNGFSILPDRAYNQILDLEETLSKASLV
jgi:ABC-type phosphate/phosphonate transport system substrate-binding protein